ncbi:flagellin [Falsirhodobacter deserti]|uniref:flagellin n=1 Tax=Falsirhodobacter deserti TaxID=1365611 RepID=UPI000FE2AF99|nr:flagellin [Falsirhodobacter deserti]
MSSILTNSSAMVALQTLKGINSNLSQVQSEISTGKSVGSAKDNAAVWAISKTMEADVTGFKKISEGLAVGKSTVAVARDAAETVTDLLTQMKDKITQAQGDGVDASSKEKIQADIDALKKQVSSVVGSAQFNGRNLVDGSTESPMKVLSSLDRDINGNVKAANIDVSTVDLRSLSIADGEVQTVAINDGTNDGAVTVAALTFQGGADALAADDASADASDTSGIIEGDVVEIKVGDKSVTYTIAAGDDADAVEDGINGALTDAGFTTLTYSAADNEITNSSTTDTFDIDMNVKRGGLADMASLDVTTDAEGAMKAIEGLIKTSVDAASAFGTAQNQIETQSNFVSKLTDNLKSGIGAMVDADMEEASARLQALQVQQQLGVQALSIANQSPQSIMSLFR